jgi:hypothetical protein
VWITASSAALTLDLGYSLERRLFDLGHVAMVVDALGVSPAGSSLELARRAAHVGLVTIVVARSLLGADRDLLAKELPDGALLEVRVGGPSDGSREPAGGALPLSVSIAGGDVEKAVEEMVSALRTRRIFA